jgi:hypothetical protein
MSTCTIGYSAYKRRAFNLQGKISEGWSRDWGDQGRQIIQDSVSGNVSEDISLSSDSFTIVF